MLPLQQSYEIRYALTEYLKATFRMNRPEVDRAFLSFLTGEEGLFKGPYLSVRLPFIGENPEEIPLEIKPAFPPYKHQAEAFVRLSTSTDKGPQPTLITTGTASGKTECFLYPILDYCYSQCKRPGIKIIILYPMNALATDQAKRIAETIYADERLRGVITAGLFIGEGKERTRFPSDMGADHIIENREAIVANPPDILLTNFKMLDYGLMRHSFHNLWSHNLKDASLLRFIVLDELHTYDGAQGTDVANLIRRLKLKLGITKGSIVPVGTSATIGSGSESKRLLAEYASRVFGEDFAETDIIGESRIDVAGYFADDYHIYDFIPPIRAIEDARMKPNESYESYIGRQKALWRLQHCKSAIELGEELKQLQIVRQLVEIMGDKPIDILQAINELCKRNESFRNFPDVDSTNSFSPREEILNSIWALMSEAKRETGTKTGPFVYLQAQMWIREMSAVLREVSDKPKFMWRPEVPQAGEKLGLPPYFCRECGASGWLSCKADNNNTHLERDPKKIYEAFFDRDRSVFYFNSTDEVSDEYQPTERLVRYVNPCDLKFSDETNEDAVRLFGYKRLNNRQKSYPCCPECNGTEIALIGTKIPTLSSIGVSQLLSSDLDPRAEKERKTLAFTNSVQDAAHQAGFIEARNYRFTLRISLQQTLKQIAKEYMSLAELAEYFQNYWKEKTAEEGSDSLAYYYRFFPADIRASISDFQTSSGLSAAFKSEFAHRLSWEIYSEYGLNATIGRTLEKTGASACSFDNDLIREIATGMRPWLDANTMQAVETEQLSSFITMLLHRIRMRGGVAHPYLLKARTGKLDKWELNWNKDARHFLNRRFGSNARLPKVIGLAPANDLLDSLSIDPIRQNWFLHYFVKSFPLAPNYRPAISDFYAELLNRLSPFWDVAESGGRNNYALNPAMIQVGTSVKIYSCSRCTNKVATLDTDSLSEGAACLAYRCTGTMHVSTDKGLSYYRQVYNRNRAPRIYATEHTGMLERADREKKEIDFKQRPHMNSLNVLVATSTLEMGIDIGTLNSVMNNSVPPQTSNYLQRIGRAGRNSGSALVVNFVKSQSHDLFYFEQPQDMMSGVIYTPGCFLEAKDILFRHFFAYCIDSWTKANPSDHVIVPQVRYLGIKTKEIDDQSLILNQWIRFIETNRDELLGAFTGLYELELGTDSQVLMELHTEIKSGRFYQNLRKAFERLKQEYRSLDQKIKTIRAHIKERNLPDTSAEYLDLNNELRTLGALKRLLEKRSLLEYLTNSGLLPNYAFPETGVSLRAIVKDNKERNGTENVKNRDEEFEMVRSAQQGIKELAPGNDFYSQGYRMHISGIDTSDWNDDSVLQQMRFCSNCDHLATDLPPHDKKCPKCGDESWSAASNVHSCIRLNAVKSVNKKYDARIEDKSDDRDSVTYRMSRHLSFDPDSFVGAMEIKDMHFGIEYVKQMRLTELNMGEMQTFDSNNLKINQIEGVPVHGFVTCRYCGRSNPNPAYLELNDLHYSYCKHKDHAYNGTSDTVFKELFLMRSMQTEAIKILLPTLDFESHSVVDLFREGLLLGIKAYYNGNPDHLEMCDYKEYNTLSGKMDNYLVLYDRIPGGTGYLRKLFDKDEFSVLLQKAYEKIKQCECQYKGKDGCYRCIYTYGNQYKRSNLSRARAEELFRKLTERSQDWVDLDTGLSAVYLTSHLEESELEERFIALLKRFVQTNEKAGWSWKQLPDTGGLNYLLTIKSGSLTLSYRVIPQYELNRMHHVKYVTVPDFYFRLISAQDDKGTEITDLDVDSAAGIAVYLDGYLYHASASHLRFFDDLKKRNAIQESGQHISWTLTWDDLDLVDSDLIKDQANNKFIPDDVAFDLKAYNRNMRSMSSKFPAWTSENKLLQAPGLNSFTRLIYKLSNPFGKNEWKSESFGLAFLTSEILGACFAEKDRTKYQIRPDLVDCKQKAEKEMGVDFWTVSHFTFKAPFAYFNLIAQFETQSVNAFVGLNEVCDQDLPKDSWLKFWRLYNIYQQEVQCDKWSDVSETETVEASDESFFVYYDEIYHPVLRLLIQHGVAFEKEGSFIVNGIEAEAVLGWADKKIFIGGPDEDKAVFIKAGYKELTPDTFDINLVL